MGNPTSGSGKKAAIKKNKKTFRTRRKTKDLDQIAVQLVPERAARLLNAEVDVDLPGLGQHLCIYCDRHFISAAALATHTASKVHKRRMKELKQPIYTGPAGQVDYGRGRDGRPLAKELHETLHADRLASGAVLPAAPAPHAPEQPHDAL